MIDTQIEQQAEQEAKIMGQQLETQEVPQPIKGTETAGLVSTFTRMFTSKMKDPRVIEAGKKALEKRQARELRVEPKAEELVETKIEELDPKEPYQFNFEAMQDAEDVHAELGKMNKLNSDMIQTQRRGVVADDELRGFADDLSSDPNTIKKVMGLKAGEILAPEYILSMKQTLNQSARRLKTLSQSIMDGSASDQDKIQFHKQWEFHSQFAKQFMGVRAEYGRGLRALGVSPGDQDSAPLNEIMDRLSAGTLNTRTMAEQISIAGDTKSITNTIKNQQGVIGKTSDMFHEVFMSGILSGVQTHLVNVTGNALKSITMPLDITVASLFKADGTDAIHSHKEGIAYLKGMLESNLEALQAAWRVAKTGEAYGGVSKMEIDYNRAISANALGIKEGTTMAWAVDSLGKFVRLPTDNLMGAEDAFFKVLHERGKLRQLAHRQASEQGLDGDDYTEFVAYAMNEPSVDMLQQAREASMQGTFQQELGQAGRAAQQIRNKFPGGRYIMPFIKTPINILYEGMVERTPLALVSKKYTEALKAEGQEAQIAKAKLTVGTAYNSALLGIAMSGETTGAYPGDPKQRQVWRDNGIQPNSFKIVNDSGEIEYYSFDRLEPYNSVLGLYANIAQTIKSANIDGENPEAEKELEKLAAGLTVALTEATVNKTFMTGVKDIINLMNDPQRTAPGYFRNMANAILVPHSSALRGITREIDPIVRDAQGIISGIQKNLPFLSKDYPPILDNFGKEVKFDHNLSPAFFKGSIEEKGDRIYKEIARVTEATKSAPIHKPKKTIGGYRMKPAEYHYYTDRATNVKRSGMTFYDKIKDVTNSNSYKKSSDYAKAMYLKQARDAYYNIAKKELVIKYPHIKKYNKDKKQYQRAKLLGE